MADSARLPPPGARFWQTQPKPGSVRGGLERVGRSRTMALGLLPLQSQPSSAFEVEGHGCHMFLKIGLGQTDAVGLAGIVVAHLPPLMANGIGYKLSFF